MIQDLLAAARLQTGRAQSVEVDLAGLIVAIGITVRLATVSTSLCTRRAVE